MRLGYLGWVEHGEGLGDHAAHGPSEDGGAAESQRRDQGADLVGHAGDAERRRNAGRLPYTGVVEHHNGVVISQGGDERRLPVVHGAAQPITRTIGLPEPTSHERLRLRPCSAQPRPSQDANKLSSSRPRRAAAMARIVSRTIG